MSDDCCWKCRYPRQGLPAGAACPECGTARPGPVRVDLARTIAGTTVLAVAVGLFTLALIALTVYSAIT